ncbi:hypothetical protein SAMN05446935_2476 [Burkholderia sp. YR290]|nr:hypothetical protein SAMN05446935_2476 [Burkholderia sp. YR290]
MTYMWGLLGPGSLPSERRSRTLGVAASVRLFNELAVPGLGGVWFGKQLLLATLGVKVAGLVSPSGGAPTSIETANAIEALACWLDLQSRGWQPDSRLRGVNKMKGQSDLAFRLVREPKFYVTQPMRMSTVEALPALGLVIAGGTRFNSFECSDAGDIFVDAACEDWRPHNRTVVDHLVRWASSSTHDSMTTSPLHMALSPTRALPPRARALLIERLVSGSGREPGDSRQRRRDALAWVDDVRTHGSVFPSWDEHPAQITSPQHWADLRAGARFLAARDAALEVLDTLEASMATLGAGPHYSLRDPVPGAIAQRINALRIKARVFLTEAHRDREANVFCRECSHTDDVQVLHALVSRDARVLRLRGDEVVPGPAFQAHGTGPASADDDPGADAAPGSTRAVWPDGVSFRVRNLFLLNADLHGELDPWLAPASTQQATNETALEEAV